jgi:hypothetical protein
MNEFLHGALFMASTIAGLLFWRSWRETRDRLFVYFALAFGIFALQWAALDLVRPALDEPHRIYALRLVTFGLIIAGIVDKNRNERRQQK